MSRTRQIACATFGALLAAASLLLFKAWLGGGPNLFLLGAGNLTWLAFLLLGSLIWLRD